MTYATWLPDVLRSAGVNLLAYPGWETASSMYGSGNRAGPLTTDQPGVVWHHDASPPGDSPGALSWMRQMLAKPGQATANVWVDRYGTWHIIAAGITWHAGTTHNMTHLGIETDHTTGEDWPDALLSSLRRGTAAILRHVGRDATGMTMHKTILPGAKTDPDGLDLAPERAAVQALINNPDIQEDDMVTQADIEAIAQRAAALVIDGTPLPQGSVLSSWLVAARNDAAAAKAAAEKATAQNVEILAALKALGSGTGVTPGARIPVSGTLTVGSDQ